VAGARAVIVPSEWEETFGLVVVEAMAAGVPTIASAIGSLPELVTDGVDGIVLEPGNVAALARVLREVDEEPARFEQLGRRARKTYEERFDPDANLEELLSIYRFAIENPIWGSSGASQR
jgi:glycosyltransferase involved in cell wall biosynthesis